MQNILELSVVGEDKELKERHVGPINVIHAVITDAPLHRWHFDYYDSKNVVELYTTTNK